MIIAVGTKNPAKVNAVQEIFIKERALIMPVTVSSDVAEQPFTEEETMHGALNRAKAALKATDAQLSFGLEGGVIDTEIGMMLCNWGALCDSYGNEWIASGAKIPVPEYVAIRLRAGEELGHIMKEVTGNPMITKTSGAIGLYTAGLVSRKQLFVHIVQLLYGQYKAKFQDLGH